MVRCGEMKYYRRSLMISLPLFVAGCGGIGGGSNDPNTNENEMSQEQGTDNSLPFDITGRFVLEGYVVSSGDIPPGFTPLSGDHELIDDVEAYDILFTRLSEMSEKKREQGVRVVAKRFSPDSERYTKIRKLVANIRDKTVGENAPSPHPVHSSAHEHGVHYINHELGFILVLLNEGGDDD